MAPAVLEADAIYTRVAGAWNAHSTSTNGIQWLPLGALAGGAVAAVLVVLVYHALMTPLCNCLSRSTCYLQPPLVVVTAPTFEMRPYLQPGGKNSRFAAQRSRGGSSAPRATVAQWNAMRSALGPRVPEKHVFELLQKHGDDVRGALVDFYGPGGY